MMAKQGGPSGPPFVVLGQIAAPTSRLSPTLVYQQEDSGRSGLPRPTRTVMAPRPCSARQGGFTIIEVMIAMLMLLVGVLGTVALIDTASGVGSTTRSREAATNLGREIVEASRELDYDLLLTSTAPAALRAVSGLEDDKPATPGWQIERRNTIYTVTVASCIYDDPKDGAYTGDRTGYCGTTTSATSDSNGDDYRKLTIASAWGARRVPLIANVVNPAGGFGPRITSVTSTPTVNGDAIIPIIAGTTNIAMTVGTTPATSLNWDASDTKTGGQLSDLTGATSWQFAWALGMPADPDSYTCATAFDWVPDAPAYLMTFQPFDSSGTPGDLRTQTISIDRSTPYRLCDFAGGRNPQHGGVVDLQWRASLEGDVVSYSVWRRKLGAEQADKLVCDAVPTSECADDDPPNGDGALDYYVKPQQDNFARGNVLGPSADLAIAAVGAGNTAPAAPGDVRVAGGSQPTISWAPSVDTDGNVIHYRIYRDGQAIADRYGKTSDVTFTDKRAGDTPHTYYVSAVDDAFAESTLERAL